MKPTKKRLLWLLPIGIILLAWGVSWIVSYFRVLHFVRSGMYGETAIIRPYFGKEPARWEAGLKSEEPQWYPLIYAENSMNAGTAVLKDIEIEILSASNPYAYGEGEDSLESQKIEVRITNNSDSYVEYFIEFMLRVKIGGKYYPVYNDFSWGGDVDGFRPVGTKRSIETSDEIIYRYCSREDLPKNRTYLGITFQIPDEGTYTAVVPLRLK